MTKVLAVYEQPFWREEGLSGQGFAPYELVRELYDNSPPSASAGVLCTFLAGEVAERVGRMDPRRGAKRCSRGWPLTSGSGPQRPLDCIETEWSGQEWTRGAYGTSFGVGGLSRFGEDLRRPIGPIHWACTDIAGVGHIHMEGATRSGARGRRGLPRGPARPLLRGLSRRAEGRMARTDPISGLIGRANKLAFKAPYTPAGVLRRIRSGSLEDAVGGRVVMITGSSSGIGKASALRIGAAGGTVLLVARNSRGAGADAGSEIAAAGGRAHVHPCDLSDLDAVGELAAAALEQHGHVDVLVNNAAHSIRRSLELSYERMHDFQRTMQINYFGAVRLMLGLLPIDARARFGPDRQHLLGRGADPHTPLLGLPGVEGRAERLLGLDRLGDPGRRRPRHDRLHAAGADPDDRPNEAV